MQQTFYRKVTLHCSLQNHPCWDLQYWILAPSSLLGQLAGVGQVSGGGLVVEGRASASYYDPSAGLRLTGSPPAGLDTATAILSLHPRAIPASLLAQSTPVILTSMY